MEINRLGEFVEQLLGKAVIVTTAKNGVVFGYLAKANGQTVFLERSRCAVYWSKDTKGVWGLAAMGPTEGCRISPPANAIIDEVHTILCVSESAAEKWESAPWDSYIGRK